MISIRKIKEAKQGETIARMSEDDRIDLMEKLPVTLKMIGIQPPFSNEELATLEMLLKESFGMITASELNYAFQLYIAGDIDVPKEHLHFGQLNLKFIGSLLKKYLEVTSEAMRSIKPEAGPESNVKQLTGKSDLDTLREDYIVLLNWIKNIKQLPGQANFLNAYNYLKTTGRITLTDNERREHVISVKAMVNQEADLLKSPDERREYRYKYETTGKVFMNRCKEEYCKAWLQEQLINGADNDANIDTWIDNEIKLQHELSQRKQVQP